LQKEDFSDIRTESANQFRNQQLSNQKTVQAVNDNVTGQDNSAVKIKP